MKNDKKHNRTPFIEIDLIRKYLQENPIIAVLLDRDSNVQYINQKGLEVTGFKRE